MLLINRIKVHGLTEVADGKDVSAARNVRLKVLILRIIYLKKLYVLN